MENGQRRYDSSRLIGLDDGEVLISQVKKHPFGLVLIYLSGIVLSLLLLAGGIGLSLFFSGGADGLLSSYSTYGDAAFVVFAILSILFILATFLYAYVFSKNTFVLTSEKIAIISYKNIFTRKISQLNIADVQDVTFVQVGPFARILNFGTVTVETAGEQVNCVFNFAPDPSKFSREIIIARERSTGKKSS